MYDAQKGCGTILTFNSILPYFCSYISRFSARGRWILCVIVDVAEIVGVAMKKNGCGPKIFAREAHLFLTRLATMEEKIQGLNGTFLRL